MPNFLLGIDVGSSSVKVSLLDFEKGTVSGSAISPKVEMGMLSHQFGWAEQEPRDWWLNTKNALSEVKSIIKFDPGDIAAIGISYQMHGLVLVDKNHSVLRPSIIWCDSRAVGIGEKALSDIGEEVCLSHMLNSPGNFTASKLKWVKDNEPELYDKVYKFMLPGDFIAMKLTGEINTTISGLSECVLWDYKKNAVSEIILNQYGINESLVPEIVSTFSHQGTVSREAATELGLIEGIPVTYRAGDQPNNAFSLNVLNAGEVAATAGTSGVIYGVSEEANYDPQSRVNTFIHVNHRNDHPKYGVLLCINGTGIQNSWLRQNTGNPGYDEMNKLAASIPVGSEGVCVFPFGNGAERVLNNKDIGSAITGLNFNTHKDAHLYRAAQEGIVFALRYGLDVMKQMGLEMNVVKAGEANMFLSPLFREAFANTTASRIELYNTDGAQGAARAAGIAGNVFSDFNEAFYGLEIQESIEPDATLSERYEEAYQKWLGILSRDLA